ncbi:hypothetical protein BACERE00183_04611 [Bacillus cereus]|nr:hypothetical protein BACERE00183_04611 [Bacillus cereus]
METLDAPIYEVSKESDWYKSAIKRKYDINHFFKSFKEKYGTNKGFVFYHSDFFGVRMGTEAYELFKDEILKNPKEKDFYPFKKRSKYYKEIKALIEQIEDICPFKAHDVFGTNNFSGSQWVEDRWFFGVNNEEYVKSTEVIPVDFKEYLKAVMETLD